ncbi:hypothetical protein Tco_0505773 [Tanacetum coccineum]
MEVLVKTCLMPLAIKTQNDSFTFVHELKQEMHADLKYVESLEKEIDELESDKAEFSNMYEILLQECVSNDVMCSYFHSLSDLDAHAELQCLYVHKEKECECLAQKLLKQNETVSKEVYNELLRSFAKLEKNSISLELALQQCQEQMKNDTVYKEKASNFDVSNRTVNIAEPPRNQKTFLKSKDLACPTCKKCIYSANHDECILKYLSKVSSCASAQKKDAQSHKITKRYMPVEKKCDSKKHDRQIPRGQKFSPNKPSNVYLKTMPPRSGLTWKPTGRIFTQDGLKWSPIKNSVETRHNTNECASPLGKKTHNPNTTICANSSSLSAALFQLKSDSLPHAHAQTTKTYYKHQDSSIKKAQVLKTKTSAYFDIKDNSSETKLQGRLLESFQEDAKYEHVGQDTRSQGGKDDQDKQGKYLKISELKTKSKDNDKGSRSNIIQHEGTSLQQRQRPRSQELNDKSNLI